ncbi:MAG TPA: DUF2231 domain-containing protein [Burkholderiales bacterium]|nr:DUF2231 domain-containing protein [Burkholderiales bacterium]
MALRLQELHPSLVHFPIALVPLAVGFDLLGKVLGSRTLMRAGKALMPVAAGSAVVTAAAGLIAQESVQAQGRGRDLLITHRNMNLGLVALAMLMSAVRAGSREPGWTYLAAGLGAVGAMQYTAYLGGKMVYDHGVGVRAAAGLKEAEAPEILPGTLAHATKTSGRHLVEGARRAAEQLRAGELAPALRR